MVLLTIPKILFNHWFYLSIIAVIVAIHYFWGKTPPPPKPSHFFIKHKKTIARIGDIFLILCVLFGWKVILGVFNPLSESEIKLESSHYVWWPFLISSIGISGLSGVLLGDLSVFQSNLTKVKRFILLIICLLPTVFTILALLIGHSETYWPIIKLGLIYSFICWINNGPAIIIGRHFFWVAWVVLRKLRLVSGDYSSF